MLPKDKEEEYLKKKSRARKFYYHVEQGFFRTENIMTVLAMYLYDRQKENYYNQLMWGKNKVSKWEKSQSMEI